MAHPIPQSSSKTDQSISRSTGIWKSPWSMVLAGRRGRRSVAESEASKREWGLEAVRYHRSRTSREGFGAESSAKLLGGKALSLSFLGLNLVAQGSVRGRQKLARPTMHGALLPHRQGCAMFIRCFFQWPSLDQVIEMNHFGSWRLPLANLLRCIDSFCDDHVANRGQDMKWQKSIVRMARVYERTLCTGRHAINTFRRSSLVIAFCSFPKNHGRALALRVNALRIIDMDIKVVTPRTIQFPSTE